MSSEVEISGVTKVFPVRRGEDVTALAGIDMGIERNEFVSIVGTSGCGKSTLLSLIAGLDEPTTGEVSISGEPVLGPGRDRGVVFQAYTLYPWLTARDNIAFALRAEGLSRRERDERARAQLALVGLEDFADALPKELSGGMKQRVAIARALSYHPRVLLMDEPFGALDALTRQTMQELLTEVWEEHRLTVLFVTHDVDEATYLSDRVLVMTNRPGRIKDCIDVTLPRPRTYDLLTDSAFIEIRGQVLDAIHTEATEQMNYTG